MEAHIAEHVGAYVHIQGDDYLNNSNIIIKDKDGQIDQEKSFKKI